MALSARAHVLHCQAEEDGRPHGRDGGRHRPGFARLARSPQEMAISTLDAQVTRGSISIFGHDNVCVLLSFLFIRSSIADHELLSVMLISPRTLQCPGHRMSLIHHCSYTWNHRSKHTSILLQSIDLHDSQISPAHIVAWHGWC